MLRIVQNINTHTNSQQPTVNSQQSTVNRQPSTDKLCNLLTNQIFK
ncbi:MAG: hypothetical protein KME64_24475 [Scytonematopsis contorta HA4267-MV1]|nr:hypothetical protein [Scytonematopsis contorta HA4267-MV1]